MSYDDVRKQLMQATYQKNTGSQATQAKSAASTPAPARSSGYDDVYAQLESSLGSDARLRDARNRAGQASGVQTPAAKWQADRGALIKELNDIDTYSGWIADVDQADQAEKRRREIIAQLEQGDLAAGILSRSSEATGAAEPEIDYTSEEVQKQKAGLKAQRDALVKQAAGLSMYGAEYTDEISDIQAQISALDKQISDLQKPMTFGEHLKSAGTAFRTGLENAGLGFTNVVEWALGERSAPWWFLNEVATLLTGEESPLAGKNPVTALKKQGQQEVAYWQNQSAIKAAGNDLAQSVSKHSSSIAQSSPFILMNLMSLGVAGTAAAGTTEGLSYVSAINSSPALQTVSTIASTSLKDLATNPAAQYSFVSTFGSSYQDALDDGATESAATIYALLNAGFGTIVEMGGGLEAMPEQLVNALKGGNTSFALEYAKDIAHEIGEEEIQRVLELGLKFGHSDVEWLDQENPDSVFNLNEIVETAADTAIDTAVMGGVQSTIQYGANAVANAVQPRAQQRANPYDQWRAAQDNVVNDISNMAAENAAQAETEAPAETAPTAQQRVGSALAGGTVSNRIAESIINDPELAQAFTEMTGVELTGTKSEQRKAVKDAAANYGQQQETQTVAGEAAQQTERERSARERLGITAEDVAARNAETQAENLTAELTEEQKKQNRTETMRGILSRSSEAAGVQMTDEEATAIAEGYEAGTNGRLYAAAATDAYKLGKSGKYTLEEAMKASQYTARLSADQFRNAFEAGAGTETNAVDASTEDGKQTLTAALSSLGEHAEEAANAYEAGQDVSRFAAGMSEAAERYAITGADIRAQDGGIPAESVISTLTDAQIEKAQEIGGRLRETRAAAVSQLAEQRKAIRAQAQAIEQQGVADAAALTEVNRQIREANKIGRETVEMFEAQRDALTKAVEADPDFQNTEEYAKAFDEAKENMERAVELQKSVEELQARKKEIEGKAPVKRKKGTVSLDGGNIAGTDYAGIDRSKLTRQQQNIVAMVERLADFINIDYVVFDGPANMGGAYALHAGVRAGRVSAAQGLRDWHDPEQEPDGV